MRDREPSFMVVITTTDKKEVADNIAQNLVSSHLAACVQVLSGVESTYIWKEKVEVSKEYLLFIKTVKKLYEDVEKKIREIHNYELPEIIALPVEKGYKDYLKWIEMCTDKQS